MNARDEILGKLKSAPKGKIPPRPNLPPWKPPMSREELIAEFTKNLVEETGVVHRVKDDEAALGKLAEIAAEEGVKKILASTDEVVARLNLPEWGPQKGIQVVSPRDFSDRVPYRDAAFDEVQAGITGVDFAVGESGSLGLIHNKDQARLVSLAPILHIAIVPVDRIVSVYEEAIEKVFGSGAAGRPRPSQFVFITGPSMTGDIQGALFKGMHGPRKVIAILIG